MANKLIMKKYTEQTLDESEKKISPTRSFFTIEPEFEYIPINSSKEVIGGVSIIAIGDFVVVSEEDLA